VGEDQLWRYKLNCVPGFNGDQLREAVAARCDGGIRDVRLRGLTEVRVVANAGVDVDEVISWALHDLLLRRLGQPTPVKEDDA
jgi:hypothetical protein